MNTSKIEVLVLIPVFLLMTYSAIDDFLNHKLFEAVTSGIMAACGMVYFILTLKMKSFAKKEIVQNSCLLVVILIAAVIFYYNVNGDIP